MSSHTSARSSHVFLAVALADLEGLHEFIREACKTGNPQDWMDVRLAVEEVFTNIYTHGYGHDEGWVEVMLGRSSNRIEVEISDEGPLFDPATAVPPDLEADLMEREIGGLGWHFVRQVMDEVSWVPREGGGNTYRLVKLAGNDTSSIDS